MTDSQEKPTIDPITGKLLIEKGSNKPYSENKTPVYDASGTMIESKMVTGMMAAEELAKKQRKEETEKFLGLGDEE